MKSLSEQLVEMLHAKKLERSETGVGGLHDALDEIAKKLGIKSPDIFIPSDKIIHLDPIVDSIVSRPNAMSIAKDKIIISKELLNLFGLEDLKKPVSSELKAILGHEMHHCANRTTAMVASRLPVLALPIAAVVGTYLYDRAKKKATAEKDVSPKNVAKHIDDSANKAEKIIDKKSDKSPDSAAENNSLKGILNAGKYIAMAAVGLGAGLYVSRHGSRFHEFAADRFGASVTSKDAMSNALQKLYKSLNDSMPKSSHKPSFAMKIISETVMAHPSLKERTSHIYSM